MKAKLHFTVFLLLCNFFIFNLNAQYASFSTGLEGPGCAPLDVWFYNYSDTSLLISPSWEWEINGQFFNDWEPPMQTFDPGYYTVILTLLDQGVPFDTWQEDIVVYAPVTSFMVSSGGEGCPGEQLQFWVDESTPVFWMEWNFGDNAIPEDQDKYNYPVHTFYEEGIYDVTLIINHYCGMDTIVQQFSISGTAKPVADGWLANGPDFCPSDPVIFDADGDFNTYLWNFGDGNTSTERRPSHVYATEVPTTYNAYLTVTNSCGNTNTDTVPVTFIDNEPAYADIHYWFDKESMGPCPGSPVEFETYGTGIYEWDFGDGSASNERKAVNYYTEPGKYYITLTVWNGCGSMAVEVDSIEVMFDTTDMPIADFWFDIEDWAWDELQGDTLHVCPGTLIGFRNDSYSSYYTDISYEWNFGDGTTALSKDASHVYNTPAPIPYPVTMVASNSCGGSDTMARYVMVDTSLQPYATPGVMPEIICDGEMVFFYIDESVEEGRYTFDIDFGDGTFLTNATTYTDTILQTIANHVYTGTAGTAFDYVFSISNQCGNTLVKIGTITITDDPKQKPFYYVSNTTALENERPMEDWSVRQDSSDHEFVIHFVWPGWPGTQNNFGVFFWYDGFYPDDDMGPADGYVEIKTSQVVTGDSVHAYIPLEYFDPYIIGFAVGWSCDGTYPQNAEPEVWGMQFDLFGVPQNSFPLQPSGYTNMSSIGTPVILDMNQTWDGLCNDQRPGRNYYYQLNEGQYIQLGLDRDSSKYYLDATRDTEGYDWIAQLSFGDYYILNKDTIEFWDWGDCIDISGLYRYSLNGDSMDFFLISDACPKRVQYLTGFTFLKKPDFGGGMMEMSGCPGDKVLFKIAGGSSYEWHFGDGSPVSNEPYPIHVYSAPGDYDAFVVAINSCGRTDTIHTPVKIVATNVPYAYFWWDGWDFPRMEPIQFHSGDDWSDEAGNFTYHWEFGDGTTSVLRDPVHAYERNGDYAIKLTVYNGCGNSTSTQWIYIEDAILNCEAKIRIDSVVGRTVYFRDISRGDISNWFWDFGDGFTSGQQDPVYTYDYDGIFFVCLSVFDSLDDCAHQVCRQVNIGTQLCIADFTANVNQVTKKVQFTDLSTNPSEWFWDFGDGNFSDLKDPFHPYSEPGWYYVCLSVYDKITDCFAYRCMEIQVGEEDSSFCFADFSFFVDEAGNSVIFSDESSDNITNWYWTFGDGTFIEDRNPVKQFIGPGIYGVCLIVFDANTGCADEICKDIPVGVSECNLRSDFAFFIDITTDEVTFNDRSGGKATDWFWDFGDGGTSSNKSPRHKYEAPGFYLVILSIWDELTGCSDHMAEFIQIGTVDCRSAFEYNVDPTTRNVQFYNQSTGTLSEYFWYFDDGTYSDEKDPSHQFEKPGMYFVSLTVVNDNGLCMDYYFEPIQVGTVECAARFIYFIDSATNVGYFTPEAIGSATAYLWFFGDGAISTERETRHAFTQPGYFTVGLNTFDEATGCMDYYEDVILIGRAGQDCRAGFSYISDPVTMNIKFSDRSKGKIVEYIWEFGDGSPIGTGQNPEHTYLAGGYYLVCLTVVNEFGIPNTFCDYVQLATSDEERCFAEFFFTIDSVTKTVEFVQQSFGNPDGYLWDFGDGTTSALENPENTYSDAGYYLVGLSITNSTTNCTSNRFELINVAEGNQGLRASFSYKVDSSDLKASSYPVDFIGVSLGDAGKLKWTFGDGTSDTTTMNPRHEYTAPGVYTACLTISNPITEDENSYCQEVTALGTGIDPKEAWSSMLGNYPNPFERITYIVYELPEGTSVDLVLFDQTGRMVDILVREDQIAGHYRLEYDGSKLDSGIYILRLATGQGVYTARMIVR